MRLIGALIFTIDGHLGLDSTPRVPRGVDDILEPRVVHRRLRRAWEVLYLSDSPLGRALRLLELPRCLICGAW